MTKHREPHSSIDAAQAAESLRLLVAVADHGSFTAAGERLGLTPSSISKAVARTEERLGARLLLRTTRSLAFTDLGEAYVQRGRQLLADLEGLEREASARDGEVRGVLRVSAPAVYGALKIAPQIAALQRKHPALDVQLRCDDRMLDMVTERIDVAVRMLATPPAEFVARAIADDRRGLYASPAYLRRAHAPKSPEEMEGHAVIAYSAASGSRPKWGRGRIVFATDSVLAAREAALAGLGIAELPEYLAEEDVTAGRLREILPGAVEVTRQIFVIYLPSRYLPPQVRACVDLLAGKSQLR